MKKYDYNQQMNIKYDYLEKITIKNIVEENTDKWFNQSLCEVNSSVLRLGIFEGEYHMHKHEDDDEVFFVLEGTMILETEKKIFTLNQYEGCCVPKGTMHRPIVAEGKAVVLMIENKGIDPIGTE
ncbi:cupin domain-containing protein [Acidaminobacter sp. JC074]|uniref:cupin domain-containing protein n=1 Tax=Acidaminobacter sp. JC074 TaxID=2530199 RepID=UPI001F10E71D|nr:cupin domain-containing protein [Acidaminobacter sp. JC074]MCH4887820.1 cupin domain-containing protein [Acidaminobacter sp. JC074]